MLVNLNPNVRGAAEVAIVCWSYLWFGAPLEKL